MAKRNWTVIKKVSDSKISNVWLSYYSDLKQAAKSCNEMGYDPFCAHQIFINYTKDFEASQNRRKKFIPELRLIDGKYTSITNSHNNLEIFIIQNL